MKKYIQSNTGTPYDFLSEVENRIAELSGGGDVIDSAQDIMTSVDRGEILDIARRNGFPNATIDREDFLDLDGYSFYVDEDGVEYDLPHIISDASGYDQANLVGVFYDLCEHFGISGGRFNFDMQEWE